MVLRLRDNSSSILQGELMGMIASTIIAMSSIRNHCSSCLFSDHLNTVRLVEDHQAGSNTNARLRYAPEHPYYCWLTDLVDRNPEFKIQYTRGHAKDISSCKAKLNFEADHYASTGSTAIMASKLALVPTPTFWMDEFTFQMEGLGWIESNIKSLVTSLMS